VIGSQRGNDMRETATRWRSFAWVLITVWTIGAVIVAADRARVLTYFGAEELSTGDFIIAVVTYVAPAAVLLAPFFMISRTMDGVASVLDELDQVKASLSRESSAVGHTGRQETAVSAQPSARPVSEARQGGWQERVVTARRGASMVFCETCQHLVSRAAVSTAHQNHRIRTG
jgi:VIT1/CCC1 family predicted Fe2+/Mn2+ transporter